MLSHLLDGKIRIFNGEGAFERKPHFLLSFTQRGNIKSYRHSSEAFIIQSVKQNSLTKS